MESNFQHLWNLSKQISVKRNDGLKSHYLLQCKELEGFGVYDLPSKLFSDLMMCKFCFNVWNPGNFSMKILPQQKPGRKMMKLLHKRTLKKKPLTKYELSLLDKYDNNCSNKISLLCLLCHKSSNLSVKKPLSAYSKMSEAAVLEDNNILVKTKKKKKKKDLFAGLNRLVCTPKSVKQKLSRYSNTKTASESDCNSSSKQTLKHESNSSSKQTLKHELNSSSKQTLKHESDCNLSSKQTLKHESDCNSSSKQTLKHLKTTNGMTKSNIKMRNSPYNSPLTSKTLKSKGLQKILFQDKNKSKTSALKAFLADL